MKKLSTGDDSTLKNYRKLASMVFGADSPQVKFLDGEISESPNGENEEVISDEGQVLHLLGSLS